MKLAISTLTAAWLLASGAHAADELDGPLTDLANGPITEWISAPVVLEALRRQNAAHASLTQDEIIALDTTWREQVVSGGALIDNVLGNDLSGHLRALQEQGAGRYTEIFVSDIRGLNVGQSGLTSDYWQGDEAKWQVPHDTFRIHVGEVEFDESSSTYQSQVSVPIIDNGSFAGVITVGIDVEMLAAAN
ncbi:MAG: PDC sensor domain-containing protein [Roseovarius sp.]